jgi:glycosyltransferase involved in cell wall biosynthesis
LEEKYQIPPGTRWVLQGARLQRYKGHEYLLRALAALPPSLAQVHAVITGGTLFGMEADYPAELRVLAEKLGIAARVHFTGFIDDHELHGFQAAADLVVHPALDEDFGLILAECQALGVPALAFASPGPMAIILEGETGRLIPVGDQAAFSAALADMLRDPARLREWGQTARERSRRLFSSVNLAAQLERFYLANLDNRISGGGSA